MRRSIVVMGLLAGTALAGGAAAQELTVYGLIDLAVERIDGVGPDRGHVTRMPGLTGAAPSRIGVRGSEDLGGGLRAVFTLEQGIAADSGSFNQGGRAWGRQSFVGLAGPWGSLTFGRQYSMLFWALLDADLLGPSTFSSGSLDAYLPNARVDNALAWRGSFGSWTLGATASFGRDAVNAGPGPAGTNCAGESAVDRKACRQTSAMLRWESGGTGAVAAIDLQRGGAGAFAGLDRSALADRRSTLAAWWRQGAFKLGAGVIARRNDANAAAPRSDLWYAGLAHAATAGLTLEAEVFRLVVRQRPDRATLVALRATQALSRRTAVYVTAGRVGNEGALALPVSAAAAGGGPAAGGSQTGLAAGLRHVF